MKNKPRRFKTRNGSILEESKKALTVFENGYMDDYEIINSTDKKFKRGGYICLLLNHSELPMGGGHGEGWDIIEEVF